jgi:glycosyltransferase involved in cell wall biosynthesis
MKSLSSICIKYSDGFWHSRNIFCITLSVQGVDSLLGIAAQWLMEHFRTRVLISNCVHTYRRIYILRHFLWSVSCIYYWGKKPLDKFSHWGWIFSLGQMVKWWQRVMYIYYIYIYVGKWSNGGKGSRIYYICMLANGQRVMYVEVCTYTLYKLICHRYICYHVKLCERVMLIIK